MSARQVSYLLEAMLRAGASLVEDPGDGEIMRIELNGHSICEVETEGAETRLLHPPGELAVGMRMLVTLKIDGGPVTIVGVSTGDVPLVRAGQCAEFVVTATEDDDITTRDWELLILSPSTSPVLFNVRDFGATGDGVTDDTAAFQSTIDAAEAADGSVFIPAGQYRTTGRLTIADDNMVMYGEGNRRSVILWSGVGSYSVGVSGVVGTSGTCAILVTADGVSLTDFGVTGPSVGIYVGDQHGIVFCGESSAARVNHSIVRDVRIQDIGSTALFFMFADRTVVLDNEVEDCGYIGIGFTSCDKGLINRNRVKDITPGTALNMYGISCNHDSTLWPGNQTTSPFCNDFVITDNYIENVQWQGIDAHGGFRFTVANNRCFDCEKGISIATGSGTPGASNLAGGKHAVYGNLCEAVTSKYNGAGIDVQGGSVSANDDILVFGNVLSGYGNLNSANTGSINATYTRRCCIFGNTINDWRGIGIYAAGDAGTQNTEGLNINNNAIGELAAVDTFGFCIYLNAAISKASVTNNIYTKGAGATAVHGLRSNSATNVHIDNNRFEDATTPYLVGAGATVTDNSATPSVAAVRDNDILTFAYTAPVTVTDLVGGRPGKTVTLTVSNANAITIANGGNFKLDGGVSWVGGKFDTITLFLGVENFWCETTRANHT